MRPISNFADFCRHVLDYVSSGANDAVITAEVERGLGELLVIDGWLDEPWRQSDSSRYQQHLLYCDPQSRFSIVSFVWGIGQSTPIHDHGVWGVVGVLEGAEATQRYIPAPDGAVQASGPMRTLMAGDTEILDPVAGDIHQVSNAMPDRQSISIHVYGADIGSVRRRVFREDGSTSSFISGYATTPPLLSGDFIMERPS